MQSRPKPILYTAFANDLVDPTLRLKGLDEESHAIESALAGLIGPDDPWTHVLTPGATPDDLVSTFSGQQVTIFHYAGHANPEQILLQSDTGGKDVGNALKLEDFLARQSTLKLVFLNACSTQAWAQRLTELGVPCVIATSRPVQDVLAPKFANAFYQAMAKGATVRAAFDNAVAGMAFSTDAATRSFGLPDPADQTPTGLPWALYTPSANSGAGTGTTPDDPAAWTLAIGADNPLIGLPPLAPSYYANLPDSPYVSIAGYTPQDAALFFGRNAEIRRLFDWVMKTASEPPILLFYGQSGVGKSSLLNAGLLPRLTGIVEFDYIRRTQNLTSDFNTAIGGSTDDQAREWVTHPHPRLLIFDQFEECITHNNGSTRELTEFLTRLVYIFSLAPDPGPRVILSFRKEYLAEVQNCIASATPDQTQLMTNLWLDRLDHDGVTRVVTGPTQDATLRAKYVISFIGGEDLPDRIASDLDKDDHSPISTFLGIILNKLWQAANKAKAPGESPVYSTATYLKVASENPLQDFFDEQLCEVQKVPPGCEADQGLELDLLYEHTTDLVTSRPRTFAELQDCYPTVPNLQQLLDQNVGRILTRIDTPGSPTTALAHDTLAPVIRREFELSSLPGSRARRLLENRARDWTDPQKHGDVLDPSDFWVVQRGLSQMRSLTAAEQFLFKESRRRRLRSFGTSLVTMILVPALLLIVVAFQMINQWNATQQLIDSTSASLASHDGLVALVQALQAQNWAQSSWQLQYFSHPDLDTRVHANLLKALRSREVFRQQIGDLAVDLGDCSVTLDERGRPLLSVSGGTKAFGGYPVPEFIGSTTTACDPVTRTIAFVKNKPGTPDSTFAPEAAIYLWNQGKVRRIPLDATAGSNPQPNYLALSPGAKRLVFGLGQAIAVLDLTSQKLQLIPGYEPVEVRFVDQNRMGMSDYPSSSILLFDLQDPRKPPSRTPFPEGGIGVFGFGTTSKTAFLAIGGNNVLSLRSLSSKFSSEYLPDQTIFDGPALIDNLAINADGSLLATDVSGRLDLWAIQSQIFPFPLASMNMDWDLVRSLADTYRPVDGFPLHLTHFRVADELSDMVRFSPDGKYVTTASFARPSANPAPEQSHADGAKTQVFQGHLSVWGVAKIDLDALGRQPSQQLFLDGCQRIATYLDVMASEPDLRETKHFDYAGLRKGCLKATSVAPPTKPPTKSAQSNNNPNPATSKRIAE